MEKPAQGNQFSYIIYSILSEVFYTNKYTELFSNAIGKVFELIQICPQYHISFNSGVSYH